MNDAAEKLYQYGKEIQEDPNPDPTTQNHLYAILGPVLQNLTSPEPSTLINGVTPEMLSQCHTPRQALYKFAQLNGGTAHLNTAAQTMIDAGITKSHILRNVQLNLLAITRRNPDWTAEQNGFVQWVTMPSTDE